ncbi:MAG: T9SS type A sorting domain-containing protein, partial [Paludibacter sp.]|nr:T9SS type A sorting domain-containing protein [Paludibacter sp.]
TNLKTALGSNNPTVTFEVMNGITAIDDLKQNSIDYKITNDGILHYTGTAKRISLWDINGRILSSTSSQTLDMNNLSKGVYFLRIEEESGNQTRTIKIKY